ncbi:probable serine carboxypeptidase CPVL isoform X2 [Dermacentor silvarum]|uniref:probable serine carboxypeptidase CPVL isoform X2 n=1 Tax=Dermacentor silvarum TaxID=543639 RepID=UPI002101A463|nr:probable serine carboxypeptidase CPVL isoform X2 [Dermacentor silvarum]
MNPASAWTLLLFVASLDFACCSTDSGPLFLTPLIEQNKYDEARTKSRVDLFAKEAGAIAHSGFITVNKTVGSNLFFLYVQAQENPSTAPLVLWTQGGPGMSSLFGQFLEFGPLGLDADGKLYKRLHTMQSDVSVIYLDVPVGSGYSFTKDTSGYPDNLEGIAAEAIEFLAQFLVLFPEYKERDFYAAGESYGARYAIAIAYQLRTEQVERVPLKLQGAIAGDGFMGSIFDVADSGEFLYQASMVTPKGRDALAKQFSTMRSLVAEGKETEALQILLQTIFANPTSPTLFQNLTLYNQQASALYSEAPASMFKLYEYVDTKEFREAIHVGLDVEFQKINQDLLTSIELDYLRDISAEVELLLNTSKMMFYMGQVDTLFPSTNQRAHLRSLNWTGASEYRSAPRNEWTARSGSVGISGYIVRVRDLTEAVVLGAGHYAAVDKSDEVNYLINNFVSSSSRFHKPISACPLVP